MADRENTRIRQIYSGETNDPETKHSKLIVTLGLSSFTLCIRMSLLYPPWWIYELKLQKPFLLQCNIPFKWFLKRVIHVTLAIISAKAVAYKNNKVHSDSSLS